METKTAVISLAALAHGTRLAIFRALVQAGPSGLPAGTLSTNLDIPPSSLSFHLKELAHADLVRSRQDGRYVIYEANFVAMTSLVDFLTENCCNGSPCPDLPKRPE